MIRRVLLTLAGAMLMMGCASSQAVPASAPQESSPIDELSHAMQDAERELDQFLQASDRPDCVKICALRNTICSLASRICLISERNPDQADVRQRCEDALRRCERARVRVSVSCQCTEAT